MIIPPIHRGPSRDQTYGPVSGANRRYVPMTRVAFSLVAGVLLLVCQAISESPHWDLVTGTAGVGAFSLAGVIVASRGQRLMDALRQFNLVVYFCIAYIIVFSVAPIVWVITISSASTAEEFESSMLAEVTGLLSVFIVLFSAGTRLVPKVVCVGLSESVCRLLGTEEDSYVVPLLLLGLSWCASGFLWVTNSFGYVTDAAANVAEATSYAFLVVSLTSLSQIVCFWMAWRWRRGLSRSALYILVVAVVVEVILGFASGMKSSIVSPLVAVALGLWAGSGKFPWRTVCLSIAALVLVIAPFIGTYRDLINVGAGGRIGTDQIVETLGQASQSKGVIDATSGLVSLVEREMLIREIAVIKQLSPNPIEYKPLTDLLVSPLYGIIPRALWPTKPILSTGMQFAVEYRGQSVTTYSSRAVTLPGDLWRHGGWLVVAVGGIVLGLLLRLIDAVSDRGFDARYYFTFILLVPSVRQESDVVTFVAAIPAAVALALVAGWLGKARRGGTVGSDMRL